MKFFISFFQLGERTTVWGRKSSFSGTWDKRKRFWRTWSWPKLRRWTFKPEVWGSDSHEKMTIYEGSVISVSYGFDWIYFKGVVIHSSSYRHVLKRKAFTVIYKSCFGILYGYMHKYVKVLFACFYPDQCCELCICKSITFLQYY